MNMLTLFEQKILIIGCPKDKNMSIQRPILFCSAKISYAIILVQFNFTMAKNSIMLGSPYRTKNDSGISKISIKNILI